MSGGRHLRQAQALRTALCALLLAVMAFMFFARACDAETPQVLRLKDGEVIGFPRLMEEVKGARVIFVGEDHLREENHLAQLAVISKLHEDGVPVAVGLEMFTAGKQRELDRWVAGKLSEAEFRKIYHHEWNMPWSLYRDIFHYAREHRIPLIGLNVPRTITRKVARHGFAALSAKERKQLPKGITCTVDPAYRSMIRKAFADHYLNDRQFEYFCEAQMLWNRSMARHLGDYLEQERDAAVVVLAGVGHAMKGGVPAELPGEQEPGMKVLLPELPGFDRSSVTAEDADYLFLFHHAGSRQ